MPDELGQDVPKTLEGITGRDLAGFELVLGWNLALPRIREFLPSDASSCMRSVLRHMYVTDHSTLLYTLPEDGFILKLVQDMACEVLDVSLRKIVQRPRPALLLICPDRIHAISMGGVNAHNLGLGIYNSKEVDDLEYLEKWPDVIQLLKAAEFRSLVKNDPDCFKRVLALTERGSSITPPAADTI